MTKPAFIAPGCGYIATACAKKHIASGGTAFGTTRSPDQAEALKAERISASIWAAEQSESNPETEPLEGWPEGSNWLISTPPTVRGCPAFEAFADQAKSANWIGYLSTTGVYGDLGGGWAFEETPRNPQSPEAERRARAEDQWQSLGAHVFRLPGIYGPGRSQLERIQSPNARRIIKAGQVFSRAHRDDIVDVLMRSMAKPNPGRIYNICDDRPAPSDEVLSYAAKLLNREAPPAIDINDAGLSQAAMRFYAECKRVSNARAKAELGWQPIYPTYKEGLAACL